MRLVIDLSTPSLILLSLGILIAVIISTEILFKVKLPKFIMGPPNRLGVLLIYFGFLLMVLSSKIENIHAGFEFLLAISGIFILIAGTRAQRNSQNKLNSLKKKYGLNGEGSGARNPDK